MFAVDDQSSRVWEVKYSAHDRLGNVCQLENYVVKQGQER